MPLAHIIVTLFSYAYDSEVSTSSLYGTVKLNCIIFAPLSTALIMPSTSAAVVGALIPTQYGRIETPWQLFPPATPAIPILLFVLAAMIPATRVP